jgi:hypothetical protein
MAEFGEIRGMAVSSGLDQAIGDLYKLDEMARRAKAISESKAKMFADDMDYGNAMNSYDNPIIKEYAQKTISEIGQFMNENPGWETDPNARLWINNKKRELKDNPDLIRGMTTDASFKELNNDLAEISKNPEFYDTDAYNQLLSQRDNYLRFGNQDGEDAAKKEGKKAFIYKKPRNFVNLTETFLTSGQKVNPSIVKKGSFGEYWRDADPKHLDAVVNSLMQEHGRQISVEANKLGLRTPEEVKAWITDGVKAGVKTVYEPGDPNAWWKKRLAEEELALAKKKAEGKDVTPPATITAWDALHRTKAGMAPPEDLLKVLGDKPQIKVVGNTKDVVDLTGFSWVPDGKHYLDGNNQRRVSGFVDMPLEQAKSLGIYSEDATSFASEPTAEAQQMVSGLGQDWKNFETRKGGISAEYLGKAVVRKGADGKDGVVRVSVSVPIDKNDNVLRQRFNNIVEPTKFNKPISGESEMQSSGTTKETWTAPNGASYEVGQIEPSKKDGKDYLITRSGPVPYSK